MKAIDPFVLAKIQDLPLKAKLIAEGVLSGTHRSRHLGVSVEYADHKDYSPGDDLRFIDWRAYARRDKFLIKRFEEDTAIRGYLVLDQSGSMSYKGSFRVGSKKNKSGSIFSKLDYAKLLAASLAYLILHQKDAVALAVMKDGLSQYLPPRSHWNHFHHLITSMEESRGEGKGNLAEGLQSLSLKLNRRGLFLIFSDLFEDFDALLNCLRKLRSRRHDVVLFHVLDRWEIDFPFYESTQFIDLESKDRMVVQAKSIRDRYLEEMQNFLKKVRAECLQEHVDYHLAVTDEPPDQILTKFLIQRKR